MRERTRELAGKRIARIEGQIRGIGRMISDDEYCIDVLTQLNSVSSAIDGLRVLLLDDHVRGCVADAVREGDATDELDDLEQAFRRFLRA